MRQHNKSLHPIWSLVPAFASCSLGAANAGPMAQTGELNRYVDLERKCTVRALQSLTAAFMCFALISCDGKTSPSVSVPIETKSKGSPPSSKAPIVVSQKHISLVEFSERLSKVKIGWSKQRLLEYAGEPKEKKPGTWFYKYIESERLGGMFEWYTFTFENDVVSDINSGGGCEIREPRNP